MQTSIKEAWPYLHPGGDELTSDDDDDAWRVGVSGDAMGSVLSVGSLVQPEAWTLKQDGDITSWLAQWFPKALAKSLVALKTPIKVELVAGITYKWCVCGLSKKQPFCDGSHFFKHTSLSPLKFKAQETCMVARCTCKATQKPLSCDEALKRTLVLSLDAKNDKDEKKIGF
ncbi:hypothetical protein Celaphus_00002397 [Cervus elaphus hippelaphus]|uniref:Iron-binding zinc finger CDGSH type domain-containing protein n=1 Tax=Cervus elaphus hippelaphus TaxID=46360 RepID=A0A212CER1_CEREH|nr:hypothetical protein Celaphus_00002397 [Cervus elaphus hippelaphus]